MSKLDGKVAVVTGAGGGIGTATSVRLAADGAVVVVADITAGSAEKLVGRIRDSGGQAVYHELDVRSPDSFRAVGEFVRKEYGRIDLLHNNAGATHLFDWDRDLITTEPEHWDEIFTINVRSVMLGCRTFLPLMIERGGGAVVNMSSIRAVASGNDLASYGASKAAVESVTRYTATTYGRQGVRCNAIQPGYIHTQAATNNHTSADALARLMAHISAPVAGTPEDIASLVSFLASDESGYITGQVIRIDGGMLSRQPFASNV